MTTPFSARFALLLCSTIACVVAACGGKVVVDGGSDGAGGDGVANACANPMTAAECAMCFSGQACQRCVRMVDPAGSKVSDILTARDCGCAAGSMCHSACMDDPTCPSGTMPTTPGCFACLEDVTSGDPCVAPYLADCEANADCNQYLADVQPCL